jgi:hypothetical protein
MAVNQMFVFVYLSNVGPADHFGRIEMGAAEANPFTRALMQPVP